MQSQPLISPWVFFLIPAALVGLGLLVAYIRRGSVDGTRMTTRRHELHHAADPATVFARIKTIGHPYRVDDSEEGSKRIVLSTNPTFATWGFLYPIQIEPKGTGSIINIGIESRFFQFGPLVTKWHNKVLHAIEETIGVPSARVVG